MLADAVPGCEETATPVAKSNVIRTIAETDRDNFGTKRVTSGKVPPNGLSLHWVRLHDALATNPNRAFDIEAPSFEARTDFRN